MASFANPYTRKIPSGWIKTVKLSNKVMIFFSHNLEKDKKILKWNTASDYKLDDKIEHWMLKVRDSFLKLKTEKVCANIFLPSSGWHL